MQHFCVSKFPQYVGLLCMFWIFTHVGAAEQQPAPAPVPLTLERAEQLALAEDPEVERLKHREAGFTEQAVADGQLPDPNLKLGVVGLPVDSFDHKQEAMTQLQLSIQQRFPAGETLHLQSQKTQKNASIEHAKQSLRQYKVRRAVRLAYLEVYYQTNAAAIVRSSRDVFAQLVAITEVHYASGRQNQQDVVRSQLELSRLDDREAKIWQKADVERAELARWIGDAGFQPLVANLPVLPDVLAKDGIKARLPDHPEISIELAKIDVSDIGVNLARQRYKPSWMLDVTYGQRFGINPNGSSRANLLSAMVNVNLPIFTDKRQDRRLAAKQETSHAARFAKADRLRELTYDLESAHAMWRRLGERARLFQEKIVPEAKLNSEASMNAYQSGVTEFTTLMRAQLLNLDVRLQSLRVDIDSLIAAAKLLYLMGEK